MSRSLRPIALLLIVGSVLLPAAASAAIRTVVVSPVPGNPLASGTALVGALAAITDASSSNRYLLKIEPGIFDVGTGSLEMKEWIDIEGSGEIPTVIQGLGSTGPDLLRGIVKGASNAELRELTVTALPSPELGYQIPLLIILTSPRISHVTLTASGGQDCWGIRNGGGSPDIDDVTISSTCDNSNAGIDNVGSFNGQPRIQRSSITARNGRFNYGIFNGDLTVPALIRDVQVVAANGTDVNYGIYFRMNQTFIVSIVNSTIEAKTGSGLKYGIYAESFSPTLTVDNSQVRALGGGTKTGIQMGGTLTVRNSVVAGTAHTVWGAVSATIGSSQLDGGPATPTATCAGVYDESYVFSASACP